MTDHPTRGDTAAGPPTSRPISPATREWWAYERARRVRRRRDDDRDPGARRDHDRLRAASPRARRRAGRGPVPGRGRRVHAVRGACATSTSARPTSSPRAGTTRSSPVLRGVGGSGGRWDHGSFRQAGRDAHDLIEWLAAQPFSDGRIGMFGESFGGQTSYGAAVERPEHLVAIAPMQSPSSLYHDVVFPGGIKSTERGEIDNWPDIANLTSGGVIDADAEFAANRAHPTFDGFWRDRSFVGLPRRRLDPGARDRRLERRLLPVRHPRQHRGAPRAHVGDVRAVGPLLPGRAGRGADVGVHGRRRGRVPAETPQLPSGVLLAWFDHWVTGLPDVPVPPAPTFTSFEGPVGIGAGWCELDGWDPTGGDRRRGSVSAPTVRSRSAPTRPGAALPQATAPDEPVDTLTFTSAPLASDQVLLGHPSLTFRATLDAADAHFYVELVEVDAGRRRDVGQRRLPRREPPPFAHRSRAGAGGRSTEYCVAIRAAPPPVPRRQPRARSASVAARRRS